MSTFRRPTTTTPSAAARAAAAQLAKSRTTQPRATRAATPAPAPAKPAPKPAAKKSSPNELAASALSAISAIEVIAADETATDDARAAAEAALATVDKSIRAKLAACGISSSATAGRGAMIGVLKTQAASGDAKIAAACVAALTALVDELVSLVSAVRAAVAGKSTDARRAAGGYRSTSAERDDLRRRMGLPVASTSRVTNQGTRQTLPTMTVEQARAARGRQ